MKVWAGYHDLVLARVRVIDDNLSLFEVSGHIDADFLDFSDCMIVRLNILLIVNLKTHRKMVATSSFVTCSFKVVILIGLKVDPVRYSFDAISKVGVLVILSKTRIPIGECNLCWVWGTASSCINLKVAVRIARHVESVSSSGWRHEPPFVLVSESVTLVPWRLKVHG